MKFVNKIKKAATGIKVNGIWLAAPLAVSVAGKKEEELNHLVLRDAYTPILYQQS